MNAQVVNILRNALHEPACSLIVADVNGNTLYVNQPFTDATGFTLEDMIGRKPGAVLQGPATEKKIVEKMHRDLTALRPTHVKITNYSKTGQRIIFILDIQPVFTKNGSEVTKDVKRADHIGFVGIQQDISDSSQDDYYRDRVTDKFLSEITQMRNLLGLLQHDIRDSLNSVIMMSSMGIIDHEHTMRAINNCLKITEKYRIENEISDVRSVVDDIFRDVSYRAMGHRISLVNQVPPDLTMKINTGYLFIILRNYIINAIKFGGPDSTVTVTVTISVSDAKDQSCYLAVSDQGPGIPEDIITRLLTQESGSLPSEPNDTAGACGMRSSFIMCRNLLAIHGYHVKIISNSKGTQILVGNLK